MPWQTQVLVTYFVMLEFSLATFTDTDSGGTRVQVLEFCLAWACIHS